MTSPVIFLSLTNTDRRTGMQQRTIHLRPANIFPSPPHAPAQKRATMKSIKRSNHFLELCSPQIWHSAHVEKLDTGRRLLITTYPTHEFHRLVHLKAKQCNTVSVPHRTASIWSFRYPHQNQHNPLIFLQKSLKLTGQQIITEACWHVRSNIYTPQTNVSNT